MKRMVVGVVSLLALSAAPAVAQDAEGCKDHPLFTRFPNMHITDCQSSQFDVRGFPTGAPDKDGNTKTVEVEGPVLFLSYEVNEGTTPPSGLQIMRNFEAATKKAGGAIEGQWPGLVQGQLRPGAHAADGQQLHQLRPDDEVREGQQGDVGLPAGERRPGQLPADDLRAGSR